MTLLNVTLKEIMNVVLLSLGTPKNLREEIILTTNYIIKKNTSQEVENDTM